jgi:hypothetical protein
VQRDRVRRTVCNTMRSVVRKNGWKQDNIDRSGRRRRDRNEREAERGRETREGNND